MLAPEEKLKPATKPYLAATARFANGADTPRDFLERCLADLAALEPKIGAFVHLNLEGARAAADQSTRRWREGRQCSPIDGMPLGIKDIIETADMPTENGSPLFAGWRSERDGASVAALREAGAVIVGETVTTEFAATEPRGTRNPHDLRRTPGGIEQRFGGRRRGGNAQRRTRHPGNRVDHSASQLLRLHRLQGERRRAQPRRQL
jgi:Asp-tRNA(Asn)/Glu-tRNA(Gln) amidotransferase A subunit family amidase